MKKRAWNCRFTCKSKIRLLYVYTAFFFQLRYSISFYYNCCLSRELCILLLHTIFQKTILLSLLVLGADNVLQPPFRSPFYMHTKNIRRQKIVCLFPLIACKFYALYTTAKKNMCILPTSLYYLQELRLGAAVGTATPHFLFPRNFLLKSNMFKALSASNPMQLHVTTNFVNWQKKSMYNTFESFWNSPHNSALYYSIKKWD